MILHLSIFSQGSAPRGVCIGGGMHPGRIYIQGICIQAGQHRRKGFGRPQRTVLWDTVNERVVRILVGYILAVFQISHQILLIYFDR